MMNVQAKLNKWDIITTNFYQVNDKDKAFYEI